MKNFFGVLLLISIMIVNADAQYGRKSKNENYSSRYGVKIAAGAVLASPELTLVGNESDYVVNEVKFKSAEMLKSIGVFGQKKFGYLFVQGDLLYSNYGMNFDVKSFSTELIPDQVMSESFHYIDLQVMGGLTGNGFRIGVGPAIHILAGHNTELTQLEHYNEKLRDISFGFSGGIGYDTGIFSFDLKYENVFRTLGDHVWYGNRKSRFVETPNSLTVAVAIALSR
ncbi:MAG: hypothetical protein IPM26_03365 [Saprospiraceae bacterium]|nr:hypothetical protein [Saprospiraceae bacterium]